MCLVSLYLSVQEAGFCSSSGSGVAQHQVGEEMCPELSEAQTQHQTHWLTRDAWPTANSPLTLSSRNPFATQLRLSQ